MHFPQVQVVIVTLLVAIANTDAQCLRCTFIETAVKTYLNTLRNKPAINPSLDYAKIETHIGEVGGATDLSVSFTNLEVIGIPGFVIDSVKFSLVNSNDNPGTLNISLTFPELVITGENYKIFGIIADALPLHADGPFEIKFKNFNLNGHGLLYSQDFYVEDVLAEVTAEVLTVEMTNILGDLSDAFNEMLSEIGLQILGEFSEGINLFVGNYLEKLLNNLLPGGKPEEGTKITTDFVENAITVLLEKFSSILKKKV